MVSYGVLFTLLSYTDLLLVKPELQAEKVAHALLSEKDKGCRMEPKRKGKFSRPIYIIFADLLLVKPTLQYNGEYFTCGPKTVSKKALRKYMRMGSYIPHGINKKPVSAFLN